MIWSVLIIIKTKGRGCLLFKQDLRRFYRQIGIDIGDSSLVGFSFNGYIYFDKVLPMGFKSAAFITQRVTTAIKYICQILGNSIENYLDDLAGEDCPEKGVEITSEIDKYFIVLRSRGIGRKSMSSCHKNVFYRCVVRH